MTYTLSDREIEQLITRYENAKAESKRLQIIGHPECRFEAGRAYALESVLRDIGFDYTDVAKGELKDITSYENEISKLQNELTAYKRRLQEIAEMYANKVECVRCELKDICSKCGTSHEIECIEVLTKI